MQIAQVLKTGIETLKYSAIDSAELDARLLLQHVLKYTPERLFLNLKSDINPSEEKLYFELIFKRKNNEPLAKIIGKKSFWESSFFVNNHTLDPRPDSEVMISAAKKLFVNKEYNYRFLDLGTGSGCLILSLLYEFPCATAIATDISPEAIEVAKKNAIALGFDSRITFVTGNWGDGIDEKFDFIISNPPYIPTEEIKTLSADVKNYDPFSALDGGIDGLDHYKYLSSQILHLLKPNAYAILEFGYQQCESIKKIFSSYEIIDVLHDLASIERAIILRAN